MNLLLDFLMPNVLSFIQESMLSILGSINIQIINIYIITKFICHSLTFVKYFSIVDILMFSNILSNTVQT